MVTLAALALVAFGILFRRNNYRLKGMFSHVRLSNHNELPLLITHDDSDTGDIYHE